MRRFLLFPLVGIIAALSIGSAAALTVEGGTIQSGDDQSLTCDTNGITVGYTTIWGPAALPTAGPAGIVVTGVTISGVDPACIGRHLDVVLTGAGNVAMTGGTYGGLPLGLPIPAEPAGGYVVTTNGNPVPVLASLVTDVHVAIH